MAASSTPEDISTNTTSVPDNDNTTDALDQACYLRDSSEDAAVQLSYNIYLGSTLFFVAAGLIGNSLSVRVFSSSPMRSFSSNVYLLTLAVSDTFYLISVFLTKTLTILRCLHFPHARFDVVNRSSLWCKMLQYLTDLFSDYSTCLILAFTVERCIAAYLPMQFKKLCTVQRARITCAGLLLVIGVFIAPYHMMWIDRYPAQEACLILMEHEEAFTAFYLTESFLFRIVPVFTIAILNVFIIVRVWRITRQRKLIAASENRYRQSVTQSGSRITKNSRLGRVQGASSAKPGDDTEITRDKEKEMKTMSAKQKTSRLHSTVTASNGADVIEQATLKAGARLDVDASEEANSLASLDHVSKENDEEGTKHPTIPDSDGGRVKRRCDGPSSETTRSAKEMSTKRTATVSNDRGRNGGKREDKNLQMTIMLIIVSTSYVLAYIPVLVHFVIWKLERLKVFSITMRSMLIAQNYTRPLNVAGFAINFFLYTVSGPVFRRQLVRVVGCSASREVGMRKNENAAGTARGRCGSCRTNPARRPSRV